MMASFLARAARALVGCGASRGMRCARVMIVAMVPLLAAERLPGAVQAPPADPVDARAIALVRAMLLHDRSIRQMQWRQRVVELRRLDESGRAQEMSRGRLGFDDEGHWFSVGQVGYQATEGRALSYMDVHYVHENGRATTFIRQSGTGLIRQAETERIATPTPETLLGRWMDLTGLERLGELLLRADSLGVVGEDPARGRVTVEAYFARLNQRPTVLRVTIDRRHGHAPCKIVNEDPRFGGAPAEVIEVERFGQHGGLWVPVQGTRSVFTVDWDASNPLVHARVQMFGFELLRRGVSPEANPDHGDPGVRQRTRDAARKVFGPGGVPVKHVGASPMRLFVDAVERLNQPLEERFLTIAYPPGARIVDAMTDTQHVVDADGNMVRIDATVPAHATPDPDRPTTRPER